MIKKSFFSLVFIAGFSILNHFQLKAMADKPLTSLSFLLGTWQNFSWGNNVFEEWQELNDSTFVGHAYKLEKEDTQTIEKLQLVYRDKAIFYIADLTHNEKPVSFKLVENDNKVVFENKAHDFPQRIVYTKPQAGKMRVWIEGLQKGKNKVLRFQFVKVEEDQD